MTKKETYKVGTPEWFNAMKEWQEVSLAWQEAQDKIRNGLYNELRRTGDNHMGEIVVAMRTEKGICTFYRDVVTFQTLTRPSLEKKYGSYENAQNNFRELWVSLNAMEDARKRD